MADVKNVMGVSADDIKSIMGVDVGDIKSVMGFDFPSGGGWFGSRHINMGHSISPYDGMYYKSSTSNGNTSDFGDLVYGRVDPRGTGTGLGKARGIAGSGWSAGAAAFIDDYDYIATATTADAQDGGDAVPALSGGGGASNGTLMFFMGGVITDHMDYITIASLGTAQDAGNLLDELNAMASASGDSRGAVFGGNTGDQSSGYVNFNTVQTQFIVYHTSNNAVNFGDLANKNTYNSASASQTRWVQKAGSDYEYPGYDVLTILSELEFYTVATEGSASAFGDIDDSGRYHSSMCDGTRGEVWGGSDASGTAPYIDNIWYITMASESDGTDAGNIHAGNGYMLAAGLSGAAS